MSYFLRPSLQSDTVSDKTEDSNPKKQTQIDPGTCYEVFRNNTTAVEVVVKEVHNKNKNKMLPATHSNLQDLNISKLQQEVDNLKYELAKSKAAHFKTNRGLKIVVGEMKKQLDAANQLEMERQKENLALQLENEKVKTLLEFKTNMITKFKKELTVMKRLLKFVMKSMTCIPNMSDSMTLSSDAEYEEFESDLKKNIHVKFAAKLIDSMGATFDSTISKETKDF